MSKSSFQSNASVQGAEFERQCRAHALRYGFEVENWGGEEEKKRLYVAKPVSIEVDLFLCNRYGRTFFVECKGSFDSKDDRNGMSRTDTIRKALFNAYAFEYGRKDGEVYPPFIVLTNYSPKVGTFGWIWLVRALQYGVLAALLNVSVSCDCLVLKALADADSDEAVTSALSKSKLLLDAQRSLPGCFERR